MKKKAWLYYHIDAPEDSHGALKGQHQQLMDYAEQMGVEVVGSSCDIGNPQIGGETGLSSFYEAVTQGKADILLLVNPSCIFRNQDKYKQFLAFISLCKIQVYSPLSGRITFYQ